MNEYGGEVESRKGRKSTPKKRGGGIESKRVEQYLLSFIFYLYHSCLIGMIPFYGNNFDNKIFKNLIRSIYRNYMVVQK